MAAAQTQAVEQRLSGGSFYGSVAHRREIGEAIFSELRHAGSRKLPAHSHEMPFFCLFIGGDYGEQYGRRYVQLRPFTLSFRPAEVPHMDEIGARGARMFGIEAGRRWQDLVESASGRLQVAYDTEGGDRLWLALKLFAETQATAEPDRLQVESLLAELLAATACCAERACDAPFWLRRMRDRIAAEHCETLTLEQLACDAGVHPVHVSRSFRRFTGYGLGEYVRRTRLRHACESMLTSDATLAEISIAAGFADQSHFTRACHGMTGFTPANLRALIQDRGTTSVEILCPRPS